MLRKTSPQITKHNPPENISSGTQGAWEVTTSKLQRAVVCAIGALREGVLLVAPLAGKGFVFLHFDYLHEIKMPRAVWPLWVMF